MTTKLTLDDARAAVREAAQKVLDEPSYKERLALATDESRASGIDEAIEKAAALLVKTYDPEGKHPLPNAARARLRNVLDDMLGIRAEQADHAEQARARMEAERAEKKRAETANANPNAALLAECERIVRVYVKHSRGGEFPALSDELRQEIRTFGCRAVDLIHLIEDSPNAQSAPFPVDALGTTLRGAVDAVVEAAQCPPSLAAAALFAHAAGAVQAIADVRTNLGKLLTTVAVLIVAESSEGKNLVWKVARAPYAEYEKWLARESDRVEIDFAVEAATWKAEHDAINKNDKLEIREKVEKLKECLRRRPKRPSFPTMTFGGGGTVEGIIRDFGSQLPTAIHSTSEGAQFFRGAAFGDKNSASSGSMTIDLVDDGRTERSIMGDGSNKGRIRLRDVRLSQVISIQPKVVLPFVKNEELGGLGLLARYAKAVPEPIAHERVRDSLNAPDLENDSRVRAYKELVIEMLRASRFKPDDTGAIPHPLLAKAMDPFELRLSREATIMADDFANEIAPLTAPGKRYGDGMKEAAHKSAERAIRFAGSLHVIDAFSSPRPADKRGLDMMPFQIGADVMERAITIARWFLDEERRYQLAINQIPESHHERLFLDWLKRAVEATSGWKPAEAEPDGWVITKDDRKRGPNELRFQGAGQTAERERVWKSMLEAMASARPPRVYFIGDLKERGFKVRIPRRAVYP
jgi:hypothetical protein